MKKTLKLIVIIVIISSLLVILKPNFYQKNTLNVSEKTIELEEECTSVIVTGTHAKDGRSILMKNRDMTEDQYQKPTYHASYQGGQYSYVFINYMGMSESGLATMNTAQSGGLVNWQYNYHGTYDAWEAMEYILSHFSDVEDAVNWLIRNSTGANCIGVIGRNSSVGAFVWIDGDHKAVTWVNNSHDAAANSYVPDVGYGGSTSRAGRAKYLLDQFYNEKGYISWEEVMQEISKDQLDREKTNDNCYSYSGCICRESTWSNMVAVSGNSSYDGRLNIMWSNYGENAQIGLYLPLMPGVIDSSSDMPTIFSSGNGVGGLVEVKRNYARDGCTSGQWNGTRVREIHGYSLYAENYTFKKYDELMATLSFGLSYSDLKTRLKDYVNDSVVFATNVYISESIPGDTNPSCSISSIIESSSYAHSSGNTLWYNTASSDSFTVNLTANDDKGVSKASFPATVSVGGDDSTKPYSWIYSWDTSDTYSGTATVNVYDTIGQTGSCNFNVIRDATAPTSSVSIAGSYTITLSCSDTGSGCNKTYYCIDSNNACLPVISYTSPISTSCSDGCYVRFQSTDNINNVETIKSSFFDYAKKNTVLDFNFNESSGSIVHDSSGYNNNGNIFGAIYVKGKHDFALRLDGVSNYIEVPHSNYITGFSSAFSATFWTKFNDIIKRQTILNKYDTLNNQRGWFVEYQNHSTYGKVLGFFASSNGINYSQWYASFSPQTDRWYHIAIVWEANNIPRFYVNGQQISTTGTEKISNVYNNTGAPLHIGKSSYISGREFNGIIDELKIYNYGLNSTEINTAYLDENKNIFNGFLTTKQGTPLQAVISADSQYTTTKNGEYLLKINSGIYNIIYNLTDFYVQDFFIKLLSSNITSDLRNVLNNIAGEDNRVSFIVDINRNQTIQISSPEKPKRVLINGTNLIEVDSYFSLTDNTWFYDSSAKSLYVLANAKAIAWHVRTPQFFMLGGSYDPDLEGAADKLKQDIPHTNYMFLDSRILVTDGSTNVTPVPEETLAELDSSIAKARQLGWKVYLRIKFRGAQAITFTPPAGQEAIWWENYAKAMEYWAEYAQNKSIDLLCIGAEETALEDPKWSNYRIAVIDRVRNIYKGQLCYNTNWWYQKSFLNNLLADDWLKKLDYIAISLYPSLAEKTETFPIPVGDINTPNTLIWRWHHFPKTWSDMYNEDLVNNHYEFLSQQHGKQIIFHTGLHSRLGTTAEPWLYNNTGTISLQEQANWFEAFFQVFQNESWVAGVAIDGAWQLNPNKPANNIESCINNKPAAVIVEDWFNRLSQS